MDIIIPKGLSEYKLYSTAKKAIEKYELDEVNLNEFPIRVFNKMAYSLKYKVDPDLIEKLNMVFIQKGSYMSVIKLLEIFNIKSEVSLVESSEINFILKININLDILENIDFLTYLSDCISYLIFFNELVIMIKELLISVKLEATTEMDIIPVNIQFITPNLR